MKDNNKVMLFVDSVSVYRAPDKKSNLHKLHRLDDIKALLNFGKIVTIEVEYLKSSYKGIIKELNNNEIILNINNEINHFSLENVSSITIIDTN